MGPKSSSTCSTAVCCAMGRERRLPGKKADARLSERIGARLRRLFRSRTRRDKSCAGRRALTVWTRASGMPARITGSQVGLQYVWRVPVVSASGQAVCVSADPAARAAEPKLVGTCRGSRFRSFRWPLSSVGSPRLYWCCSVTRPVVRLRKAARELATGKLSARVPWPKSQSRIFAGDEIHGLMHDFNHMAERLESLVDAQKLLLRDVSHELRSPLARLSVALELAREDADPATAAHLDRIERETERLNQLIGQLLSLSSMEALEKVENFEPLSLNRLIDRMIPDAEYEARQRQCSLAFNADGEFRILRERGAAVPGD